MVARELLSSLHAPLTPFGSVSEVRRLALSQLMPTAELPCVVAVNRFVHQRQVGPLPAHMRLLLARAIRQLPLKLEPLEQKTRCM
jgi:hypothetical protein